MKQESFLDLRFALSKKLDRRPTRLLSSARDHQLSGLLQVFVPDPEELQRIFDKMDRDGDGRISFGDLRWLLKAVGSADADADAEAKSMLWAADLDGDGFISFGEFMEVHKKGVKGSEIHKAFRVFDRNGDGRIGADELMTVLRRLGERCSLDECERMVRRVGRSGNGLVDVDDFVRMMTRNMKLA